MIGDGPLRNELESRAAALGIADRVTFLGAVGVLLRLFGPELVPTPRDGGHVVTFLRSPRVDEGQLDEVDESLTVNDGEPTTDNVEIKLGDRRSTRMHGNTSTRRLTRLRDEHQQERIDGS